jgi:hypothetical protein
VLVAAATLALLLAGLAGCASSPEKDQRVAEKQAASQANGTNGSDGTGPYAPCHEKPAASTPSPDVARVESVAMSEDRFWALIDDLHHSLKQSAFDAVSRTLSQGSVDDIVAFDARMTLDLYELDTACRVEWYGHHDPDHLGFPLDDDFLYFRCSTIIAGRDNFQTALSTQTLPWGSVSTEDDGESLLYIGLTAAEDKGVSDARLANLEKTAIPLSYETASNPQGWPKDDVDQAGNIPN